MNDQCQTKGGLEGAENSLGEDDDKVLQSDSEKVASVYAGYQTDNDGADEEADDEFERTFEEQERNETEEISDEEE